MFVGNGSDEVLAHVFTALLKHDAPLLFPDITYSFYPVYCRLFGIAYEAVPLDQSMQSALPTIAGRPARSSCPIRMRQRGLRCHGLRSLPCWRNILTLPW